MAKPVVSEVGAAMRQQVQGQPIPFKTEADGAPPASGLLVLFFLLGAGVLAWAAVLRQRRRAIAQGQGQVLKVVETQRLAPRSYVSVVEFGGQRHLLAQNEHGMLHVASTAIEPARGESA